MGMMMGTMIIWFSRKNNFKNPRCLCASGFLSKKCHEQSSASEIEGHDYYCGDSGSD